MFNSLFCDVHKVILRGIKIYHWNFSYKPVVAKINILLSKRLQKYLYVSLQNVSFT